MLEDDGRVVETYPSCEAFLEAFHPDKSACLLIDAYLPGMSGLELLEKLHDDGHRLPAIMITGNGDVPMAVEAMKAGALDFIEKPIGREELIASIERALELSQEFEQVAGMARVGGDPPRGPDAATARGDGTGARRPAQQEHRGRSRHQPTHRREPSRLDHEENRLEVASRAGPIGARRGRRAEAGQVRKPLERVWRRSPVYVRQADATRIGRAVYAQPIVGARPSRATGASPSGSPIRFSSGPRRERVEGPGAATPRRSWR